MLELTGHFINYLLLASQRKWPVGVFLLWYFQRKKKKCRILKRESMRECVLGGGGLEAGGEEDVGRVSQSFLSRIVTPSDWHVTFLQRTRPFQLTWGLTSRLFFFLKWQRENFTKTLKRTEARWHSRKKNVSVSQSGRPCHPPPTHQSGSRLKRIPLFVCGGSGRDSLLMTAQPRRAHCDMTRNVQAMTGQPRAQEMDAF